MPEFIPPGPCPVCGEDVPARAAACPACGADGRTGWGVSGDEYDGLDLPDDDFDYDRFVREEFDDDKPGGIRPLWAAVAILAILMMVIVFILGAR